MPYLKTEAPSDIVEIVGEAEAQADECWRPLHILTSPSADSVSLGEYRLDEFNVFYAALITICAAHDFLCFQWGQVSGTYPTESAVMVRSASQLAEILSTLSGVTREKCLLMVSDLTFSLTQSVDLHVYPLIQLDGANEMLAIAPPFPLHSRHDDPNRIAMMLTQAEKQKLITSIADTCHNECKVAAGVKYTYGSVGLILEKLREPFALDGLPMEPRDTTKPR